MVRNSNLTSDLQYLPESLEQIFCDNTKLAEELSSHGNNLAIWRANHGLTKQVDKKQSDSCKEVKKVTTIPEFLQEKEWGKDKYSEVKYNPTLDYSNFLFRYDQPFSWEKPEKELSAFEKKLPTRLYNIFKGKDKLEIKNRKELEKDVELTAPKEGELFPVNDSIKKYATMSYSCGKLQDEGEIYSNARKALNKVIKALELINKNKKESEEINHVWIDQLSIIQDGKEGDIDKGIEIPKMRQYYNDSEVTLIAIDAKLGEVDKDNKVELVKHIIKQIFTSSWFTRTWTFQEGLLSKQTIFMFDDYLVDGRKLALDWVGLQSKENLKREYDDLIETTSQVFATPLGWSYGAQKGQEVNFTLGEALSAVKLRERGNPIDGIYAILGLLPYGDKVSANNQKGKVCSTCEKQENELNKNVICSHSEKTKFAKYFMEDLEEALAEVANVAIRDEHNNGKDLLSWIGSRSSNWLIPQAKENGSTNVEIPLLDIYLNQLANAKVDSQGIRLMGKKFIAEGADEERQVHLIGWAPISLIRFDKETMKQIKKGDILVVVDNNDKDSKDREKVVIIVSRSNRFIDIAILEGGLSFAAIRNTSSQELFIDMKEYQAQIQVEPK